MGVYVRVSAVTCRAQQMATDTMEMELRVLVKPPKVGAGS